MVVEQFVMLHWRIYKAGIIGRNGPCRLVVPKADTRRQIIIMFDINCYAVGGKRARSLLPTIYA